MISPRYFLRDEPNAKVFGQLAAEVAAVRKLHPGALSFINLLGYVNATAYPSKARSLYGVDTYEECVTHFSFVSVSFPFFSFHTQPSFTTGFSFATYE